MAISLDSNAKAAFCTHPPAECHRASIRFRPWARQRIDVRLRQPLSARSCALRPRRLPSAPPADNSGGNDRHGGGGRRSCLHVKLPVVLDISVRQIDLVRSRQQGEWRPQFRRPLVGDCPRKQTQRATTPAPMNLLLKESIVEANCIQPRWLATYSPSVVVSTNAIGAQCNPAIVPRGNERGNQCVHRSWITWISGASL